MRFTISGIDATGPVPVAFALSDGAAKVPGQGKVRALIDQSVFLAQSTSPAGDAAPFLVPDGVNASAMDLVKPGNHKLTLSLFYDDGTKVDPQGEGTVSFTVQ